LRWNSSKNLRGTHEI
jgi:hypothetical protein